MGWMKMSVESDTEAAQAALLLNPHWMSEEVIRAGVCSGSFFRRGVTFAKRSFKKRMAAYFIVATFGLNKEKLKSNDYFVCNIFSKEAEGRLYVPV